MQGAKVNKSRQLANDLRKSHFNLGTAEPKSRVSEYLSEYQKKQTTGVVAQGENLNLRGSHFQLGTDDPKKHFRTISQKDFKEHPGFQPPTLNEDKKRDLRSSHFVLGNYNATYTSQNNTEFQQKYIPVGLHKQEQEEQKSKMRKHNHNFNETSKNQFSSEYHKNFNRQQDPASLKQALTSQQIQQRGLDLRKSHVVFGEDHRPMQSIAQADYTAKQGHLMGAANDNVTIRRSNFQLGNAAPDMASMYQSYYVKHPAQKSEFQGALGSDLRASHFTLGQEPAKYVSNMAVAFQAPPSDFEPSQSLNPNLQKNHFSLGKPGAPIQNKTSYSNYHRDFGNASAGQARDQTQDRGSHFHLGAHKPQWVSEAQSHFKTHEGAKPADLEGGLKADLRNSHFKFNEVKTNQYTTMQQASYGPKVGQPNKLDESLKKDLQSNHFHFGGNGPTTWASSTSAAYRPHDGKPASLDPSLAKDLRSNHFTHGDGKWRPQGATEYRSNYFWKTENEATA